MINFQPLDPAEKARFNALLQHAGPRGCEYSFVNLYLWGRQKAAFVENHLVFFSQFNRKSVYLFPVGTGDKKPVLDALIQDAAQRGIPCRFTGMTGEDQALLEQLYPGQFRYHQDRNSFDYIYSIEDLATLKGRKFQRKRNHLNRFLLSHPDHQLVPITASNVHLARRLADTWYKLRQKADPHGDYQMEKAALNKALEQREVLELEGLLLLDGAHVLAMTLGSRLNEDTFDIHFEKALDMADGAYAAINREFARYLQEKYPRLQWLNREDDMGLEGLRKAKLSYHPHHMIDKHKAYVAEEIHDL